MTVTPVTEAEPVTGPEPVTVTDLATPPLWHARRVTAGAASGVTEALVALRAFGLMPDQLAGESAHLLDLVDFDAARTINEQKDEEPHMATDLDTAPQLDMSPGAVRAWARTHDLDVSPKGMVPRSITEAYVAAGGAPGTAVVTASPSPKPAPPTSSTPDERVEATVLEVEQARTIERLQHEVASFRDQNAAHDADRAAWSTKVSEMRDRLATAEGQRNQNRVEANTLAVELAESRQTSAQNREAMVVATLPGPLPEEISDLLDAWHALFAKASEVDTAAGHTLAEVALPALVRETSDQAHDLIRLLDGDVSR